MKKTTLESQETQYLAALRLHLKAPKEESLALAWRLGREALGAEMGLLDVAVLHHRCLQVLAKEGALSQEALVQAEAFHVEFLSPFEMGQRAFQEASAAMRQAFEELEAQNIELLRANAATEQARDDLESFSFSVSHDLQAPLRAIDGFSAMLEEDEAGRLSAAGKGHLARVRDNVHRMTQLIQDMLRLARVSRAALHKVEVDLSLLARDILKDLGAAYPSRQVDWRVAEGLKAEGDQSLLRIALENLINNAWKFTRKKEKAEIQVGCIERPEGPGYFVRDNGAGFDMAYQAKLFDAFQRLHNASDFEGTGIGLATVKRVISRHSGKVWCDAEPGKGATFYFSLWEKPQQKLA